MAQIRFPMEVIGLKPANFVAVDAAMNAAGFPLVKNDTGASVNLGMGGTLQFPGNPESRMYYTADLSFAVTISPSFFSLYCVDRGTEYRMSSMRRLSRSCVTWFEGSSPFLAGSLSGALAIGRWTC